MQKSARFTEADLHKAGYTVVGNEAVPLGDSQPDPSWDEERLTLFAKGELANSEEADRQAILQAHKSAVHLFRAGHALALIRDKRKAQGHGEWKKYKEQHGLKDTTVNDAIRLYERAKTEDALACVGITQAKEKFDIAKKVASQPPRPRQSRTSPATGDPDANAKADADQEGNDPAGSMEQPGEETEKADEKAGDEETEESPLNHKKVVVRLISDSDRDAVRTAVADYSPTVKTATGVRLVGFVVPPRRLRKALHTLFESLEKIESFNLEVQ